MLFYFHVIFTTIYIGLPDSNKFIGTEDEFITKFTVDPSSFSRFEFRNIKEKGMRIKNTLLNKYLEADNGTIIYRKKKSNNNSQIFKIKNVNSTINKILYKDECISYDEKQNNLTIETCDKQNRNQYFQIRNHKSMNIIYPIDEINKTIGSDILSEKYLKKPKNKNISDELNAIFDNNEDETSDNLENISPRLKNKKIDEEKDDQMTDSSEDTKKESLEAKIDPEIKKKEDNEKLNYKISDYIHKKLLKDVYQSKKGDKSKKENNESNIEQYSANGNNKIEKKEKQKEISVFDSSNANDDSKTLNNKEMISYDKNGFNNSQYGGDQSKLQNNNNSNDLLKNKQKRDKSIDLKDYNYEEVPVDQIEFAKNYVDYQTV